MIWENAQSLPKTVSWSETETNAFNENVAVEELNLIWLFCPLQKPELSYSFRKRERDFQEAWKVMPHAAKKYLF